MPVVRNPQFYFREGFCWIDVNSTYLKARIKSNGVFDVLSMSLFSMSSIPDWYFVSLINSELISLYVDNFINNTSHFQINDARQLPIVIPSKSVINNVRRLFKRAYDAKKGVIDDKTLATSEEILSAVQRELDRYVYNIYDI